MESNTTAENLYEIEDEIIDIQDDDDDQSQAPEIIPEETKNQQDVAENKKTLDEIIEELPDNFPEANSILKSDVFPLIVEMDGGMQDYYIDSLKKKFSVGKQTIKEALKAFKQEKLSETIEPGDDLPADQEEIDPERGYHS